MNYLYRLHNVQTFNGVKLAIYIKYMEFPDPEIVTDAYELAYNIKNDDEFFISNPRKLQNSRLIKNIKNVFKKGIAVLEKYDNVNKCIFVESYKFEDWHGEQNLYQNEFFDIYKSSYPTFSGCKFIKKINL